LVAGHVRTLADAYERIENIARGTNRILGNVLGKCGPIARRFVTGAKPVAGVQFSIPPTREVLIHSGDGSPGEG